MQSPVVKTISHDDCHLSWEVSRLGSYFHANCHDSKTNMAGSGAGLDLTTAKKKAYAEMNERFIVQQLRSVAATCSAWKLDLDGSCSGFAVGFDLKNVVLRSILEATERWCLSKWIDHGAKITENQKLISALTSGTDEYFEKVSTYSHVTPLLLDGQLLQAYTVVFLGWTSNGVFAGYGTKTELPAAHDHAIIEALRNFLIFQNQVPRENFPFDRIRHFAGRRDEAEEIIRRQLPQEWSMPKLCFAKAEKFGNLWVARSMHEGWEPWQNGPVSRFLY